VDYLSSIQPTQPFKAYSKSRGQLYGVEVECSMLTASAKRMASMLRSAQAQIDGGDNVSEKDKSKIRVRHMFSRLRETWANFYKRRAIAKVGLLDIASSSLSKSVKDVFTMAKCNEFHEDLVYDLLQGFAIEAIWEHAASLAYKFAEISVVGLKLSGDLEEDLSEDNAWLTETDFNGSYVMLSSKVDIQMHREKLSRSSALRTKIQEYTTSMIGQCQVGDQVNAYIKRVMGTMYLSLRDKVKQSVIECLRLDREIVMKLPDYDKIVSIEPNQTASYMDNEAPLTDLQPLNLDLSVLGADTEDTIAVAYSEDVKTVSFQLSECEDKFTCLDTFAEVNSAIKYLSDRETLCLVAETENWPKLKHIAKIMEGMCSSGSRILNILIPKNDLDFIVMVAKSVGYLDKSNVTLMTS
jgi:ribosomal protein S3AE